MYQLQGSLFFINIIGAQTSFIYYLMKLLAQLHCSTRSALLLFEREAAYKGPDAHVLGPVVGGEVLEEHIERRLVGVALTLIAKPVDIGSYFMLARLRALVPSLVSVIVTRPQMKASWRNMPLKSPLFDTRQLIQDEIN